MDTRTAIASLASRNASLKKPSKKLARDLDRAADLLTGELSDVELFELLHLVNVAYHTTGKIEGHSSIDGCALVCPLCDHLRRVPGTVCNDCYAAADAMMYPYMYIRHALNQLILASVLFPAELLATVALPTLYNRFNEDGDLWNATQARNYFRIAASHPGVRFALWFKNAAAVKAEGKPANLTCIYSSPFTDRPVYAGTGRNCPEWIDAEFTVYRELSDVDSAVCNGSHRCNGRKCATCEYCYNGAAGRRAGPSDRGAAEETLKI